MQKTVTIKPATGKPRRKIGAYCEAGIKHCQWQALPVTASDDVLAGLLTDYSAAIARPCFGR